MPKYKNHFATPSHIEETILDENRKTVGKIRVKPSSVLWRPANAKDFYSVPLAKFTEWITDSATKARKTGS